jgi:hypothetical protein
MPCRVDLFRCSFCGGEHYFANECLSDPSKYREGLSGYNPKTAAPLGKKAIDKKRKALNIEGALCDVLSLLEDKKLLKTVGIPEDILEWWLWHQSREQSKTKKEALKKLTAKEKRALGL